MRKAVSITLEADNLLWLRSQAATTSRGSLSAVLDRIVGEARLGGRTEPSAIRSVAGTIDLPEDDPDLEQADAYVRSIFTASARRPILVRERTPGTRVQRKRRG